MTADELLEQHHNRITKIIQRQAKRMATMPVFATEDPEDLSQELWLKFLPLAKHYDPSRGEFGAFASRTIANVASRMAYNAIRAKQNRAETVSLFDPVDDDGKTVERIKTIGSVDNEMRARELRHDLRVVIGLLPPHLQKLCALLAKNPSLCAETLARATSNTRFIVRRQLREIRAHFSRHGMQKYLDV